MENPLLQTESVPLIHVIMLFFSRATVTRTQLAETFSVAERTVYRWLKTLKSMGLIEHQEGEIYRRTSATERLSQSGQLRAFADFADVSKFLPVDRADFWHALPSRQDEGAITITTPECETSVQTDLQRHFHALEKAIREHRCCRLQYKGRARRVAPYRLRYLQGVWYLAVTEQQKLKTFRLSAIEWLDVLRDTFTPDATISAMLARQKTPWCSPQQTLVTLSAAPDIADYFRQRALLPEQNIIESRTDGSLLLTTRIAHPNQLFPVVRYWLPHLRIIEPVVWQQQFEEELRHALITCNSNRTDNRINEINLK